MIQMKGYKINSLEFENKVENGTQLKLQNHVKYNVNYIDAENRCVGILHFRVEDADMQPFEIASPFVFLFQHEHFPKHFDCVEKEPGVSVLAAQFVKPLRECAFECDCYRHGVTREVLGEFHVIG